MTTKTAQYNGKRIYARGKNEKEAKARLKAKIEALENGVKEEESMTVREWSDYCIENYKPNMKPGSRYESTYKNRMKSCVLNVIGNMKLKDVKQIDCQRCMNLQKNNSAYQIRQTKQMLVFLFSKAFENELIRKSPVNGLVIPKGHTETRRALTEDERERFLVCSADRKFLVFRLMYYCGLRPSEARAAMGEDIMHIGERPYLAVRGTKTEKSKRTVPIPEILYNQIKKTPHGSPIATNNRGNNINEKSFKERWDALKLIVSPNSGLVPYCLRHDYATRVTKSSNIFLASYLLGHTNITMTSRYAHMDDELLLEAYEIVQQKVQH